jgi:four helix bundle protein
MMRVDDYEVFKRAHQLTLDVYRLTKRFPKEEAYGLVSQMRRAAFSIPMNLKEGSPGSETEFFRYVRLSLGSKEELAYQVRLARDLGYLSSVDSRRIESEIAEIGSMLFGLLRKRSPKLEA